MNIFIRKETLLPIRLFLSVFEIVRKSRRRNTIFIGKYSVRPAWQHFLAENYIFNEITIIIILLIFFIFGSLFIKTKLWCWILIIYIFKFLSIVFKWNLLRKSRSGNAKFCFKMLYLLSVFFFKLEKVNLWDQIAINLLVFWIFIIFF